MTEIDFHFNVSDKLIYGCRLLRKAYASGAKVVVTAEAENLERLDHLLWTFSPTEFIPHCNGSAAERIDLTVSQSPIILAESPKNAPHSGVLVNLGAAVPLAFERFERFIELVTDAESDRLLARQRWKYYADRGYSLKRHDVAAAGVGV